MAALLTVLTTIKTITTTALTDTTTISPRQAPQHHNQRVPFKNDINCRRGEGGNLPTPHTGTNGRHSQTGGKLLKIS